MRGTRRSTAACQAGMLPLCAAHLTARGTAARCLGASGMRAHRAREPSEGSRYLAASRSAQPASPSTRTIPGTRRISFAKIREPLEVPNLLALQTDSFDWLLGNEKWRPASSVPRRGRLERPEQVRPRGDLRGDQPDRGLLRAPCRCRSATTASSRPKNSIDECKERDFTYAAPLFVTAEFMNNETGEIKSQTVFMGDFPLMTDKGTFVINGTERVVVSQLVRSPGRLLRQDRRQDLGQGRLRRQDHPVAAVRGSSSRSTRRTWSASAIDRKRKQSVTVLLKALGWDDAKILEEFGQYESMRADPGEGPHHQPGRRAARHLPQAAPGRAAHARGRADAARQPVLQPQALRPGQGRPLQGQQEAGAGPRRWRRAR